jgi:multicopper oxidase
VAPAALRGSGPRKDTAIVLPVATVTTDFDADNPGQWMIHCHNAYHAEAGMISMLAYLA